MLSKIFPITLKPPPMTPEGRRDILHGLSVSSPMIHCDSFIGRILSGVTQGEGGFRRHQNR